jgi:ParB-like chromosome segregation protein Spo0J
MQITQYKLGDLIPYINNTRTHSDKQVSQIASSIKEFGFTNPVLVDGQGGIIAGHGRVMAAQKLKLDTVPCIILDHLTDAQKKAYIIADNKLALNAGWDEELLKLELESLKELDFDIDVIGFSGEELDELFKDNTPQEVIEDEAPEPPENPISKRGDIWLLGRHRLMCGDSTSEDVDVLMDGKKADMVFTDPPYGYEYQSNMRTKSEKFEVIKNDDKILDFSKAILNNSDGWVFIWTSWKVIDVWLKQLNFLGFPSNLIVWHKRGGYIGDLKKTFGTDYEVALVWHRGKELTGKRIGSVWAFDKDNSSSYIHPTQKPVSLCYESIDKTTIKNNAILDLFGGSGSTLIASEQLNRICYMMELDEKYVDVITQRYINFKESDDDVYLIRDGVKYSYSDVLKGV